MPLLRSPFRNSEILFFTETEEHCVPEDGHAVARKSGSGGVTGEGH